MIYLSLSPVAHTLPMKIHQVHNRASTPFSPSLHVYVEANPVEEVCEDIKRHLQPIRTGRRDEPIIIVEARHQILHLLAKPLFSHIRQSNYVHTVYYLYCNHFQSDKYYTIVEINIRPCIIATDTAENL